MKRTYTSFEEIDRELKILRLQKDIHKEEIKLSYNSLKEDLGFLNIIGKTTGYIVKRALAHRIMKKIFG